MSSAFPAARIGLHTLLAWTAIVGPAVAEDPFRLRLSAQPGYDDNILQLSESELEDFEGDPDPDQYLIESTDDVVTRARVELRWEARPWEKRRTYLSGRITAYVYGVNDVKDYAEYFVGVDQEINRSNQYRSWVELDYTRSPSRYSREITDDDATLAAGTRVRESLVQESDEYRIGYRQRIVGRHLELGGGYRIEVLDYGTHFPERDAVRGTWILEGQSEPFEDYALLLTISQEVGASNAEGDLPSTTFVDDDPSYRFSATALRAELPWKGGGHFEAEIELELRTYTTDNPLDTIRFDREDDRRTYTGRVEQRLRPDLVGFAEYRHRIVEADLPREPAASDEEADYVENLAIVGIRWEVSF